ncbi:MAG: cytosine permease, partial [Bacillus sp. (in: firmicutes)]
TNTAANVVPAATIFSNVGGPKFPFWAGVITAGIVGTIVQPWQLFDVIIQVLLFVGGILAAIVGILFADYYLLRKRRVNVTELYENHGQFKYMSGVNLAGFIAWIIGAVASYFVPNYGFLVGFIFGAGVYYVLAKYWWFQKYPQAEIMDPSDEKYLGISVGRDWVIEENTYETVMEEIPNNVDLY